MIWPGKIYIYIGFSFSNFMFSKSISIVVSNRSFFIFWHFAESLDSFLFSEFSSCSFQFVS